MATWSTVKSQIRREMEESAAGIWSDDSLLWHANEAGKDIAIKAKPLRDWQYTTCVVGQTSYTLPANSLEVIGVFCGKDADDDRRQLSRQEFRDWHNIDIDNGRPVAYAIDDDAVLLRPAPDSAYELSFLRYMLPTALTGDSDSMPFGSRYDSAIIYYIKSKCYEQILDWNSADALLARYNAEMDKVQIQETQEANSAYHTSTVSVY